MVKICDICGYSTTNYSNFSRHVKAKHPNRVESKKQQNLLSENFTNNQAEVGTTVNGEVYDIRLFFFEHLIGETAIFWDYTCRFQQEIRGIPH